MKGSHLFFVLILGHGVLLSVSHGQVFASEWEEFLQNFQHRQPRQDPSSAFKLSESNGEQLKLVTEYQDEQPLYQKPQTQEEMAKSQIEPINLNVLIPDFEIESYDYGRPNNDLVEVDENVVGIVEARNNNQISKTRLEKLTFDNNLLVRSRPCRASYSLTSFNLASFEGQDSNCTFEVIPSLPSICRLSIEFHQFLSPVTDELCSTSGIQISEGPRKCGNLSGSYDEVRFGEEPIEIQIILDDSSPTNESTESFEYNITVRQINCAQTREDKTMQATGSKVSNSEVTSLRQEQGCNAFYNLEEFIIQSPKYPNRYPTSTNCSVTVFASDVNICFLELRFDEFRLEPSAVSDECANDYLEISDDNELREPRRYCGVFTGIRLIEIEGIKRFRFHSNENNNDVGYSIFVRQIPCDEPISSSESPGRTTPSFNNDDTSSSKPDFSTSRPIFSTSISTPTSRPPFATPTTTENIFFTTFPTSRPPLETTQNPFFTSSKPSFSSTDDPYFTTPESNPNPGYFPPIPTYRPPLIQITPTYPPGQQRPTGKPTFCSRTFLVDSPIRITSPHYPRRYLDDETCEYRVQFSRSDICFLRVTYVSFSLEKSPSCSKDSLMINGNKICGRQAGSVLFPQQGSKSVLTFSSDSFGTDSGFDIELSQIPCEQQPQGRPPFQTNTPTPSYFTPVPDLPSISQEISNSYGSPQSAILGSITNGPGSLQPNRDLIGSARPIPIRASVDDISNGATPILGQYGGAEQINIPESEYFQPFEPYAPQDPVLANAIPSFTSNSSGSTQPNSAKNPNARPVINFSVSSVIPALIEKPAFDSHFPSVGSHFNPNFPDERPPFNPITPTGRPQFNPTNPTGRPPFNPITPSARPSYYSEEPEYPNERPPFDPSSPNGKPPFNYDPAPEGAPYLHVNPTRGPSFNHDISTGRPPFRPYEPPLSGSSFESNFPHDSYGAPEGGVIFPVRPSNSNNNNNHKPLSDAYDAPPSHPSRPTYHRPRRPHGKRKPKLFSPFTKILNSKRKLIRNVLSKFRKPRFFQKYKKNKKPSKGYGAPKGPFLGSGYGIPQGPPIGSTYGVPQGPPLGSDYGAHQGSEIFSSSNELYHKPGRPDYKPDNNSPLPTARPPFNPPTGPNYIPGGSNHYPGNPPNFPNNNSPLPAPRPPVNHPKLEINGNGGHLKEYVQTSYDVPIIPGSSSNFDPGFQLLPKPIVTCGTITQENEFILQSPGYPNDYHNNGDCSFEVISAPNSCHLHLTLNDFIMEESSGCIEDYLELDGTRVCGQQSGKEVVIPLRQNSWKIPFKTDSRGTCRGFRITGRQISCQSEIPSKNSLIIKKSSNSSKEIESSFCINNIEDLEGNLQGFSEDCTQQIVPLKDICRVDFRMINLAFESNTCSGTRIEINSVPFCHSPGITSIHDIVLNSGSLNPEFIVIRPESSLPRDPLSGRHQRDQGEDWMIEFRQIPC